MILKPISVRNHRLETDWHLFRSIHFAKSKTDLWNHIVALETEINRLENLLSEREEGVELMRAIASRFDSLEAGLFQALRNFQTARNKFSQLSSTESLIYEMVSANRGMPYKQIASKLGISIHTVKFHMSSILSKTGLENRNEL